MATTLTSKLDPRFKYDVTEMPGGENLKYCFACGVCTACCPVSEIDENYNPRKIIRMILLGMRERVLSADFIWLCLLCDRCKAQCPQNVKFSEVMRALRDMTIKEGYVHPSFIKRMEVIDNLTQRLRRQMVLSIVSSKSGEASISPEKLLAEASSKI